MLRVSGVVKSYGENKVLNAVDFDVRAGEVHALIGENGAGKSTLVNIISGTVVKDGGTIEFDGKEVNFTHPMDAMRAGISVVHQELSLVPNATVAENIYLRREITNRFGFNDWRAMQKAAASLFERMGIDVDPKALVGSLSVGMQQLVEVAKALALDPKLIIMDEPTSSLSEKEVAELFAVVRGLRERGLGVIFISHKLSELFELSDRITVLRDGNKIATSDISAVDTNEIIRQMVGRHLGDLYPPQSTGIGDVVFSCRGLSRFGFVRDVSFDLRAGEILGIAGLVGSGRTEAMRALINADHRSSGQFFLNGKEISIANPDEANRHGIVYVSEDRKGSGLFLAFSVMRNVGAASLDSHSNAFGFIRRSAMRETTQEFIKSMDIRPPRENVRVGHLSGGNQQKVLLSKALGAKPRVLIIDEPTRGVDIGAKSLIHAKLRELAESGVAVIVISSEMPEVIGMSDRILVFRNGGISREIDNHGTRVSQESIMTHAIFH